MGWKSDGKIFQRLLNLVFREVRKLENTTKNNANTIPKRFYLIFLEQGKRNRFVLDNLIKIFQF